LDLRLGLDLGLGFGLRLGLDLGLGFDLRDDLDLRHDLDLCLRVRSGEARVRRCIGLGVLGSCGCEKSRHIEAGPTRIGALALQPAGRARTSRRGAHLRASELGPQAIRLGTHRTQEGREL